ncbi:MAG: aspartyl protease family protein [Tepidisphaeraceae bacterium]
MNRRWCGTALAMTWLAASFAGAVDIQGVLPASMDQPRIYLSLFRDPKAPPLAAKASGEDDIVAKLLGEKPDPNKPTEVFAIEAFLDTGASGTMLADATAESLGLKRATINGKPITFYDVGVAGQEPFGVTDPLYVKAAEYSGNTDGGNLGAYLPAGGPVRMKIRASGGILDELTGSVDIAGTPVMAGKVMVVDCRPVAKMDKLDTRLVLPNDRSIPRVDSVVPLTLVDFDRFTSMEPANAPKVATAPNPMIGPNPFDRTDRARPVVVSHQGKQAQITMLLDTGAASSIISTATAKALGIQIDEQGKLLNVPAKEQFTLPIGGIGGMKNINGFFIDALDLPVAHGQPIRYVKCPVLVQDISVQDQRTGEKYTLDGVFGVNYLVASASVSLGLNAGVDDIHDGPYSFFVIDLSRKTLGLKLR